MNDNDPINLLVLAMLMTCVGALVWLVTVQR